MRSLKSAGFRQATRIKGQKNRIQGLSVCLLGCSANRVPLSESETLGVYHFGYLVTHGARTGLIQVFDDGQMTFVRFLPSKAISEKERTFYSPKEEREIEKVGDVRNQVSLKGVYEEFHVVHEGRVTTVQRVSERK